MAWYSRLLADIPGIRHAFLDVHESAAFDKSLLVDIKQVHGADVLHFTGKMEQRPLVDGVLTSLTGQQIGIVTADCLPVLMASRDGRLIASLHAGWRGTAKGILQHCVRQFVDRGVAVEEIVVAVGPHIRACCYEVSASFYEGLVQTPARELVTANRTKLFFPAPIRPNAQSAVAREKTSQWFDLPRFCLLQLAQAGIAGAQIDVMEKCTYCAPEVLGSYRRRTHIPATKTQQVSWILKEK
ncbi:peptidoglycan editing factor PgeF [Enterobacter sp. CC120223-11]|uniref:peptidoglycan editing factor PgeF n=1 Tax=Enterobacter sp. CC120223-11 TaxID=1378073 RepID=UPI000BD2EAB3|nr:peptidoglycan editing factor PgeF [Enterobacter sp. CC120223-11]SNY74596.1 conserved hypothetical protein [Enterobacter sp. CC120223-11]